MVTIRDVAKRAQVSVGTVSRVLNNHPKVGPAIRGVVLEAIEELQFRPNTIARALSTSKTHTLGFLLPSFRNAELISSAIQGIETVVHEHGYTLLVADSRGDPRAEEQHLRNFLDRRIDGLICYPWALTAERSERFRQAEVPVVALTPPTMKGSFPEAHLNFEAATEEAIDHLIALGHRRISTITLDEVTGVDASVGWGPPFMRRVLRARGIDTSRKWHAAARSTEACATLVRDLLAGGQPPTALLVTPFYLVPAVVVGVRAAGARVPRDVSLIGFGDSEWAEALEPPLSVVAADLVAHLGAAARLLVDLVERTRDGAAKVESHARYIRRGSVASPCGEEAGSTTSARHDGVESAAAK